MIDLFTRALAMQAPPERRLHFSRPSEIEIAADRARRSHNATTPADRELIRLKTRQLARELGMKLKHV